MKKTEKTALTAAIFAAAMCGTANTASEPVEAAAFTSTTTSVVGSEFVGNQPAISPDAIKELNSKMAPVYGPPPSYEDSENTEEDVITTTRTTTVPLYGPPRTTTVTPVSDEQETTTDFVIAELQTNGQPVYGPAPFYGDVNDDGRTDVFDMILLRERFAKNDTSYSFMADVNYDLKISVADLVVLGRQGGTPSAEDTVCGEKTKGNGEKNGEGNDQGDQRHQPAGHALTLLLYTGSLVLCFYVCSICSNSV